MVTRTFLLGLLFLAAPLTLNAIEVDLEYCKDPGPYDHSFSGYFSDHSGAAGWSNGGEILSNRALTFALGNPLEGGSPDGLALCVDYETKESKYPFVLYADANGDRKIDETERYPLNWLEGGKHMINGREAILQNHLVAEKICLPTTLLGKRHEVFVNIVLSQGTLSGFRNAHYFRFSVEAWGCRKGRATLDDRTYEIIVRDGDCNGLFGDYEKGNWFRAPPTGDRVAFIPGSSSLSRDLPLRQKFVLDSKGFTIDVRENGKKVVIEPEPVAFGEVIPSDREIEMTLWNLDWGSFTFAAGEKKKLPAGDWFVTEFARRSSETGACCYYSGSGKIKASVEAGKNNVVEVDTILRAAVTAKKKRDQIRLSLDLATSQAASFRSYRSSRSDGEPFRGIPFMITDSAGEVVKQAHFEFG